MIRSKSKHPWARVGKSLLAAYRRGASTVTLARRFKIPRQSIADFLRKKGALRTWEDAKRNQRGFSFEKLGESLLARYAAGESAATLAQQLKVPRHVVDYFLRKQSVTRSQSEAAKVRRLKGRLNFKPRTCEACEETYRPTGALQRVCSTCTPTLRAQRRYASKRVTQPVWNRLLAEQDGRCFLCPRVPTCVDHDHQTLVVRGLLCGGCNSALNRVERRGWVKRAQEYLRRDTGLRANAKFQAQYNAAKPKHL